MNTNINLIPLHYNYRKERIIEKACFCLEKRDLIGSTGASISSKMLSTLWSPIHCL